MSTITQFLMYDKMYVIWAIPDNKDLPPYRGHRNSIFFFQWFSKLFLANVLGNPDIFLIYSWIPGISYFFTLTHSGWYRGHWNSRHFISVEGVMEFQKKKKKIICPL